MPFILLAKIKCQDDKPDVFFFFFFFLVVWESEHWNRHLILKRISEYVLFAASFFIKGEYCAYCGST